MNDDIKTKKWQEDKELARYKIIAPLTDEELDIAKDLQQNKLNISIVNF